MFPLLPFVAGVLTGAAALRLVKSDKVGARVEAGGEKARAGMEKAQGTLRGAAVSSLEAIENASARARKRLTADAVDSAEATAEQAGSDLDDAMRAVGSEVESHVETGAAGEESKQ